MASWLRREIEERLEGGGGTLISLSLSLCALWALSSSQCLTIVSPAPDFNIDGEIVHFNDLQKLVQVQWRFKCYYIGLFGFHVWHEN